METAEVPNACWCYALYGVDKVKYYEPMRENIRIAKEQGALLVLHTNGESAYSVGKFFAEYKDDIVLVVHREAYADRFPKVLRFLTPWTVAAQFYYYKDCDSVVNAKELELMDEWTRSDDPTALIIRDHPLHVAPIMAGMFALNREISLQVASSAEELFLKRIPTRYSRYTYDQAWLARDIYPGIVARAAVRTSYFHYRGETVVRIARDLEDYRYIGSQVYRVTLGMAEVIPKEYLGWYGDGLLSLPYFPRLHFLYGKVRPTLAAANLLSRLERIRCRFTPGK
jgi:hypothetical protein